MSDAPKRCPGRPAKYADKEELKREKNARRKELRRSRRIAAGLRVRGLKPKLQEGEISESKLASKPKRDYEANPWTPQARREQILRLTAKISETRKLDRPNLDPVTSERIYSGEETAFLRACDSYRGTYQMRFMNACDYLTILKTMGYVKP